MGLAKDEWMASEERGYSTMDGDVCRRCVLDHDLRSLFSQASRTGNCAYCGARRVLVVAAEIIQERIMLSVFQDYSLAQHSDLPWNGREGGWQASTYDADEVLWENAGDAVSEKFIMAAIDALVDDCWCDQEWQLLHPYQRMNSGWKRFCETVKHHSRFTFALEEEDDPGHPDSGSPLITLRMIGHLISRNRLLTQLSVGDVLYRVRSETDMSKYSTFDELASPPHGYGSSNRMSPAGIPMFYGSPNLKTSIDETWDGIVRARCSIGRFQVTAPIWIADLVNLPAIPGYFAGVDRNQRSGLRFLEAIAKDMSSPVSPDQRKHVEYAPTQIVSEYLMNGHKFVDPATGLPIALLGIRYRSSRNANHSNYVLNLKHAAQSSGAKASSYLSLTKAWDRVVTPGSTGTKIRYASTQSRTEKRLPGRR